MTHAFRLPDLFGQLVLFLIKILEPARRHDPLLLRPDSLSLCGLELLLDRPGFLLKVGHLFSQPGQAGHFVNRNIVTFFGNTRTKDTFPFHGFVQLTLEFSHGFIFRLGQQLLDPPLFARQILIFRFQAGEMLLRFLNDLLKPWPCRRLFLELFNLAAALTDLCLQVGYFSMARGTVVEIASRFVQPRKQEFQLVPFFVS